jgi:tetratricopeptide (TPR) repeat protein
MNPKLQQALQLKTEQKFEEARLMLLELTQESQEADIFLQCAFLHDKLGYETAAIPFYIQAIELGLPDEDLLQAYICLGSSYRCIGEYEKAIETLEKGRLKYPQNHALKVFLSMAKYNVGAHEEAMNLLLTSLLDTTQSEEILHFKRALTFYADHLDDVFK